LQHHPLTEALTLTLLIGKVDERVIVASEVGFNAAAVENHCLVTDADRRAYGQFAKALPRQFWDDLHGVSLES